ncbi:type 2 lanthipeptide synthetase LanM family protein [Kitasatospora nipponensis]
MTDMGPSQDAALWWTRGVNRAERLTCPPQQPQTGGRGTAGDQDLVGPWRGDYPSAEQFEARLADLGLTAQGLHALLAESPDALAGRIGEPSWVAVVDRALAAAPETAPRPADGISWTEGFATVLAPFTETAADRLLEAAESTGAAAVADLKALRRCFTEQLGPALVAVARRTLVLELHVLRVTGRLTGATPQQRFADFVRHCAGRAALEALLHEYAVLARLLAQTCEQTVAAWLELLDRLAADRELLRPALLEGADPGLLVDVRTGAGDRHRQGRAVAVLTFEHGARVVHKPRPLGVHTHFNQAVDWLGERLPGLGLRTLAVLTRPGHGWVEHAAAEPCRDPAQVRRFYHRLGALLALVHALGCTDLHYENLIACADQPVLVDLETLFHPALARPPAVAEDPALQALDDSVLRTALLPLLLVGEHGAFDLSALGGEKGVPLPEEVADWAEAATDQMRLVRSSALSRGAANRPRLADAEADPGAHAESLLAGFRAGYDVIAAHRDELVDPVGPLARFAADETRVVARDTSHYLTLLDESTHPDVLRRALDRDRLLDILWRESVGDPARRPLVAAELAELWAGDVPLVTGRPARRGLTIGQLTATGPVAEPGLRWVTRRLATMSHTDRYDQEWLIRAALATRATEAGRRLTAAPTGPGPATVPDPERLLAAACAIADQILAGAHTNGHRVNWLGLEPLGERHWAVLPQGAGLPHGYCGTALFLAQLASLTGLERYATVARRAVRPVPELLAALAAHPQRLPEIGGGFSGLGGIAYTLSQLATLLDDREIAGWVGRAVELTQVAPAGSQDPGVLDGDAGCLAAMLAVHQAGGPEQAYATALECARRLALRPTTDLPAGGFTSGAAGIGWALLRFAEAGDGEPFARAGLAALRRSTGQLPRGEGSSTPSDGWYSPLTGTALAIADSPAAAADPALAALLTRELAAVANRAEPADHSLGYGEAGILELLLAVDPGHHRAPGAASARAGALLASLDRFGPRCGTPDAVPSPGLLTGLAGIGHGLLRLGFRARIPSVLLLRAPTAQTTRQKLPSLTGGLA